MDRHRSTRSDSTQDWVARVVAWHNRHPLARRLQPAQVLSLGWVALPYLAGQPGAPGAPAAQRRGWRAQFSERFLPGLSVRRIARWVLRHGQAAPPTGSLLPLRQVALDAGVAAPGSRAPVTLWVATAALQAGRGQRRVLLDSHPAAPPRAVLGRRIWSPQRVLLVALAAGAGFLAPAALPLLEAAAHLAAQRWADWHPHFGAAAEDEGVALDGADAPDSGALPLPAAEPLAPNGPEMEHGAQAPAQEPEPGLAVPTRHAGMQAEKQAGKHAEKHAQTHAETHAEKPAAPAAHGHPASAAPAALAALAETVAAPPHPAASMPAIPPLASIKPAAMPPAAAASFVPPRLRPLLDDAARAAAREAVGAARAARAAQTGGAPPAAVAAAPAAVAVFALATPRLRTQAESELVVVTLAAAAAKAGAAPGLRLEALPAGDDWRAVCWPFARREDAERLRGLLAARGLRLELVEF